MTLEQAFRDQAISCTRLGSPFMGQLLNILADHWPDNGPLDAFCHTCTGNTGPSGATLPLRLWPGGVTLDLGRADFDGRWVKRSGVK